MYYFYIDDTGTKERLRTDDDIFAYVGIVVEDINKVDISEEINNLKIKFFKKEDVELKSRWLRLPEERKIHYLKPFSLDNNIITAFTNELFERLSRMPIHCIGSVVSKSGLTTKYRKVVFDPSPVAYELLLQHLANYMTQYSIFEIKIVIDDISGKNAKGTAWKRLLINQHFQLKQGNSPFYRNWRTRTKMY